MPAMSVSAVSPVCLRDPSAATSGTTSGPTPAGASVCLERRPGGREGLTFRLADGTVLEAVVRRSSRARRLRLCLTAAGEWRLVVPSALSLAARLDWLQSLLPFVERAWRRHRLRRAAEEAEGSLLPEKLSLPVLGREFVVRRGGDWQQGCAAVARSGHAPLRVEDGARRLLLVAAETSLTFFGDADDMLAAEALRRWCRGQAGQHLPPLLEDLAQRHGFTVSGISVRDQRSRWGSCSRDRQGAGRIRLNWRALLLPREDAAFLCLHELCHIRRMDHSAAYREELARYAPDWPERERRLSRFWRELPRWARPAG